MKLVQTVADMSLAQKETGRPLGLVPTMGALHDGHLSLVKQAREDNDTLAVSIFVNPAQFGPQEDLDNYPRHQERDLAMLKELGTDLVFIPKISDMYPDGFDTWIHTGDIANRLEGESRPDHFRGVATVVTKLFTIVRPDNAYFGQKDAQQVLIIRKINADLNLGVNVFELPTIREPDGLAMSSRNAYLKPLERQAAVVLYNALRVAERMHIHGEQRALEIKEAVSSVIRSEPMAVLDYISIADANTLDELDIIRGSSLVSLAVRVGKTRLIDNIRLRGE